jgi:hypothetical protein
MTTSLDIYNSCEKGDLDTIKNFFNYENYEFDKEASTFSMIHESIKGGSLEIIKFILSLESVRDKFFETNKYSISDYTSIICTYDRFEIMEFMLNIPEINQNDRFMEIFPRSVAGTGRIEMLKYLLDNFSENPSVYNNLIEGDILIHAARNGHLNILEYIFTHKKFKSKIDIHLYKDEAFRVAFEANKIDVLKYFIFDLNIEKTQYILNYADHDPTVMSMFDARELNHSLHQELNENTKNKKKNKL